MIAGVVALASSASGASAFGLFSASLRRGMPPRKKEVRGALRLAWPEEQWPLLAHLCPAGFAGGPMRPAFYLSMISMHGTIMVFFVLATAPLSGFGNYFLPIQVGAKDMAFPVINMMSFWVTFLSLVVMPGALVAAGDAPSRAGRAALR
jgi:cytochrome c oxidase subunit I